MKATTREWARRSGMGKRARACACGVKHPAERIEPPRPSGDGPSSRKRRLQASEERWREKLARRAEREARGLPSGALIEQREQPVRLRGRVVYDGRAFHGFQRQVIARGVAWVEPTVQTALEEAAAQALGILDKDVRLIGAHSDEQDALYPTIGPGYGFPAPLSVVGASRTDTGVHSLGQVFHTDLPPEAVPAGADLDVPALEARMSERLRALYGEAVAIRDLERVPEGASNYFDASRSSCGKRYRYSLFDGTSDPPPALGGARFTELFPAGLRRHKPERLYRLDARAMDRFAQGLGGARRNFRLFTRSAARGGRRDSDRLLWRARVLRTTRVRADLDFDSADEPDGDFVHFIVEGEGFLYLMVRCLMTALLQVGRGELDAQELLSRCFTPPDEAAIVKDNLHFSPAHASGLTLERVYYADESIFGGTMLPPPQAAESADE